MNNYWEFLNYTSNNFDQVFLQQVIMNIGIIMQ